MTKEQAATFYSGLRAIAHLHCLSAKDADDLKTKVLMYRHPETDILILKPLWKIEFTPIWKDITLLFQDIISDDLV